MTRNLRCLAVSLVLVSCSAITALASNLDVYLMTDCATDGQCFLSLGIPGNAATGNATFANTPWSFQFLTAQPISWNETMHGYTAAFGPGGSFGMTGPDNLTFAGQITGGSEYAHYDHDYLFAIDLNFTGMWSNNVPASGEVTLGGIVESVTYATLQTDAVPEPASLALLGTGIAGLWGICRRRLGA